MNLHIGMVVPLLALILIHGCTGKDDTPTSQQEGQDNPRRRPHRHNPQRGCDCGVTILQYEGLRYPFSGSTRKIMQESKMGNQKRSKTKANTLQRCWTRLILANLSAFYQSS